jgi:phosphate/sulfate permease
MPVVDDHSDVLFWQIAIPVIAVIIPLFLWTDIRRLFHYLKKRIVISDVRKAHSRRTRKIKRDQAVRSAAL